MEKEQNEIKTISKKINQLDNFLPFTFVGVVLGFITTLIFQNTDNIVFRIIGIVLLIIPSLSNIIINLIIKKLKLELKKKLKNKHINQWV